MGRVKWLQRAVKLEDEPGYDARDLDDLPESMRKRVLMQGGEHYDAVAEWRARYQRFLRLGNVNCGGEYTRMYIKKLEGEVFGKKKKQL